MYFWNVLTRCFCIKETTHLITSMKGHRHCTGDFTSKSFRMWTKAAESQTHQSFTCRNLYNPILNTKLGLQVKGYDTAARNLFFSLKRNKVNLVAILFLLEACLGFNTTLNFWPVSLIWEIVKTTTDGTWNWLMSSILYWGRECIETLTKAEATVCRSLLKLSTGSLDTKDQNVQAFFFFFFWDSLKPTNTVVKLPLVIIAPTFSSVLSQ